jgi:inner membrane protein
MNGKAHAAISGLTVTGLLYVLRETKPEARLPHPALGGIVAVLTASLPDVLEPATSPNHRQFCHSVVFAAGLMAALNEVYDWAPDTPLCKFIRDVLLSAGLAYLIHLGLDATTAKSIPWLGKCN